MSRYLRHFLVLLFSACLAGCVLYIPPLPGLGKDIDSPAWDVEDSLPKLLGDSLIDVRKRLQGHPHWEVSEENHTYLVFHVLREADHGFVGVVAGPYGGGGAFDIYRWDDEATYCFRLNFDEDLRLRSYERDRLRLTVSEISEGGSPLDCRQAFWSANELEALRITLQEGANGGDRDAAVGLVRGFWDAESTKNWVVLNRDVELATVIMREYGQSDALEQLAADNKNAEQAFELSKLPMHALLDSEGNDRFSNLNDLANSGDPDLFLLAYRTRVGSNPLRWLCLAADNGSPEARYRLGELYLSGKSDLQENRLLAYKWYRLAAMSGSHYGAISVKRLTGTLSAENVLTVDKVVEAWEPGDCIEEIEERRVPR